MPVAAILFFKMRAKNISSQDFVMWNIFCEFESTYNTLCSRGPTKALAESRINVPGGHLVFQNEVKNIPRQDFMVMNISCKFEKASYNIIFVRAVTTNNKRVMSQKSYPTTPKDSQSMISYKLVFHPKSLGPIIRET